MAPPFLTVFHGSYLTLTSAALGRLVPDATNPGQEYWPKSGPELAPSLVDVGVFENLHDFSESGKHAGLWAKVSRLFSGNVSNEAVSFSDIATASLKRYTLTHPTDYFQNLCKGDSTKLWMERTVKHFPIFLIVGLVTVGGAVVRQGGHGETEVSASAQISATDVLSPVVSAILPVGGDASSIGIGGSVGSHRQGNRSFVAPDERVIGIQYRKVKFTLFSKHDVDKAWLENNPRRWETFLGSDRAGTDTLFQADLEESISVDDLDLEEEREVIDNGELVFVGDNTEEV